MKRCLFLFTCLFVLLGSCGCVQKETAEEADAGDDDIFGDSTIQSTSIAPTTSIPPAGRSSTSTSRAATTTVRTRMTFTLAPTTSASPTSSTTSTTLVTPGKRATLMDESKECAEYCQEWGYVGGECRTSWFECRRRLEVKAKYETTRRLCIDQRYNTCCCKTEESVKKEEDELYS